MFHVHGTNLCACMYDAIQRVNTLGGSNKRERKKERVETREGERGKASAFPIARSN